MPKRKKKTKADYEDDIKLDPRKPTPFSVFVDLGRAIVHLEKAEPSLRDYYPHLSVGEIIVAIEKVKDEIDV
jgi:hypothetical protein